MGVNLGDICFVTLRAWGAEYYHSLDLPVGSNYVVVCEDLKWTDRRRKKVDLFCGLFRTTFDWNAADVRQYGSCLAMDESMILVDDGVCERFPKIKGDDCFGISSNEWGGEAVSRQAQARR